MRNISSWAAIVVLTIFAAGCSDSNGILPIPKELTLVKETDHAQFYVRDTDEAIDEMVEILSAEFEHHYNRITEMLRYTPEDKTEIWIYTNKAQYQQMIGRNTEGTYDANDQRIKVYTPGNLSVPAVRKAYTDQLIHEFVHAVIQQKNPLIGRIKWLDEGTAYYVANQLQDEIDSGRRARTSVPDLSMLEDSERYFAARGGEAYYFSGLIVKFIYEQFGAEAFHHILLDPEALETILGLSIPELYAQWKAYVDDLHHS